MGSTLYIPAEMIRQKSIYQQLVFVSHQENISKPSLLFYIIVNWMLLFIRHLVTDYVKTKWFLIYVIAFVWKV